MKNNISAIIISKNEEKNIKQCLESVSWCDEILLIDDYSDDKTVEIAKRLGAVVLKRKIDNDFSSQRNFGLENAKGDWVLFVDADERVTDELRKEILSKISENQYEGFLVRRSDFMWGKQILHGEFGGIKLLRLAKNSSGKWYGKIHERWSVEGRVGELDNNLFHFPHPTLDDFLKKINYYTDIRSKELFEKGIKPSFFSIIFYPKAKFFQNYIFKMGFLDGIRGLVLAFIMSFHSFLVRGKLWIHWRKNIK